MSPAKKLESDFEIQLKRAGVVEWERELRFHPDRMWRIYLAWSLYRIAVEIQGVKWSGGRHGRGSGIAKDAEKIANLAIMGWRYIAIPPEAVRSFEGLEWVKDALEGGVRRYPKLPGRRKLARGVVRKHLIRRGDGHLPGFGSDSLPG